MSLRVPLGFAIPGHTCFRQLAVLFGLLWLSGRLSGSSSFARRGAASYINGGDSQDRDRPVRPVATSV